jgi:hypothetical protein
LNITVCLIGVGFNLDEFDPFLDVWT